MKKFEKTYAFHVLEYFRQKTRFKKIVQKVGPRFPDRAKSGSIFYSEKKSQERDPKRHERYVLSLQVLGWNNYFGLIIKRQISSIFIQKSYRAGIGT